MLKKENEIFDNILQHDAQEFLNYLLNHIGDTLKSDSKNNSQTTWVHDLFQVLVMPQTQILGNSRKSYEIIENLRTS